MRIKRITDINEILKCLPFEREIRKKGRDNSRESDLLLFIESQLDNHAFGFWIAYDDDNEVIGYAVAMLNFVPGVERLHLLRIYAKTKELRQEFEKIGKEWCKPYKIKTMQMTGSNKKNIKAFQRMGWKVVSVNLERRI